MAISLKCGRCGKVYDVEEAMSGQPVQCKRCRFIMVVPSTAKAGAPQVADQAPPRAAVDLDAGAAMEQSASADEVSQVVVRQRRWLGLGKPKPEADETSVPNRRMRGNFILIAIAFLPVILGGLCVYWFVPWNSLLGGTKNAPPIATAPGISNSSTPNPVEPSSASLPSANTFAPPVPSVVEPTTTTTGPDWMQPIASTAPAWLPDSHFADAFGPYVSVSGFAIRGPTSGLHLIEPSSTSLTWVGRGPKGRRAELTLTVAPNPNPAQMRRRSGSDEPPDLGRIGPDALGATRVDGMRQTGESLPVRQIEYDIYDRGRHAHIQILSTANDDLTSLQTLTASAMTLRRARPGDKAWATSTNTLPPGYDPTANPQDWSQSPDAATTLQPIKHGFGYTIRPPTALRLVGSGVWGGREAGLPALDPDAGLPLLHISPRGLDESEFKTVRAWAEDQFTRFGREADWGTIDGVLFARTRYTDASTGRPATCAIYVTIFNQRFWALTTASWEASPELELAVRTFQFARPSTMPVRP